MDLPRYTKGGYLLVTPAMTAKLDALSKKLKRKIFLSKAGPTPGENFNSAAFDVARTVCRRAERRVCHLQEIGEFAQSGNHHLPEPPRRFVVAVCALDGDCNSWWKKVNALSPFQKNRRSRFHFRNSAAATGIFSCSGFASFLLRSSRIEHRQVSFARWSLSWSRSK